MAGGLHKIYIGAGTTPAPIRSADLAGSFAAPDCEQAAEPMPLPPAAAACSPLSSIAPCGGCAGTPARRCCLVLAAAIMSGLSDGFVLIPRQTGKSFTARKLREAIAGENQNLTAPIGEAA